MERSGDGERLARVSYLPGVQPPAPAAEAPDRSARDAAWTVPGLDDGADEPAHPPGAAHHVAISALGRKGLSRRELERHLASRGFDADEIADEVARLERDGHLDDVALAQTLVGSLQERKGLGRSAIAAELARRLFAPAAIEYGLELIDSGDELSRAREIALKRAGQLRDLDRDTAVRRLSAYLARRGYGGSTVRAAVEHALPARGGVRFG